METIEPLAVLIAVGVLALNYDFFRHRLRFVSQRRSGKLLAHEWRIRSRCSASFIVAKGVGANLRDFVGIIAFGALRMIYFSILSALTSLVKRDSCRRNAAGIVVEILSTPGVLGFKSLNIRQSGEMIFVDVHLTVDGNLNVRNGYEIGSRVAQNVTAHYPVPYFKAQVSAADIYTR